MPSLKEKQADLRAIKATEPQKGQVRCKLEATPKSNGARLTGAKDTAGK